MLQRFGNERTIGVCKRRDIIEKYIDTGGTEKVREFNLDINLNISD
jgi:hypothetical protein